MLKILIDANQRNNKKIICTKTVENNNQIVFSAEGDFDVVTKLQELLTNNKIELAQIDLFEYAQGPGSFTGIKMAAAVANVLNWAVKNIPSEKLIMPSYGAEPNITLPKN